MDFLPHSAENYLEALKYLRKVRKLVVDPSEDRLMEFAIEAARFAAIRKENRWLRYDHLKEMHGQPIYFESSGLFPSITSGGIVDANRELVIVLEGEGLQYRNWSWENCGNRLRFPANNIDLLDFG